MVLTGVTKIGTVNKNSETPRNLLQGSDQDLGSSAHPISHSNTSKSLTGLYDLGRIDQDSILAVLL